jgi:hypothetical protein
MPSAAIQEFDRQFRAEAVPALSALGFTLGEWRTFRRVVEHERTQSTQIIEFQVGRTGWSIGRFTVNLAVFNPDYLPPSWPIPDGEPQSAGCLTDLVQRLGFLRPADRGLLDRLLGRHPEPRDHWWHQSEDPRVMRTEMADATGILVSDGLGWLSARTSLTAFRWALRQLERRKDWKAALRSPGAPRLFTAEPFPEAS